jgi:hypothetical protein
MRIIFRLAVIAPLTVGAFGAFLGLTTIERGPHAVALELLIAAGFGGHLFVESEVIEMPLTTAGFTWEGEAGR